ncbi:TonB-dependent receptor [Bordetella genomosp. 5]|uniref:TonB-dependent siderophore receptor n=1 Tax=Bordetella genomosp. 5 TaxID=1395608 RepID=A0A261T901_9BORD|nr:TonB-dependent receptor [Bordetella genomosp. 5]OZI45777.1 TonB-dependent siderophore receptor [Bordetella genomosp. 5]
MKGPAAVFPLDALRSSLLALAIATALTPGVQAQTPAASAARQAYHVPAGSLGQALARFAAATGTPLSFDPAVVAGRRSAGLDGVYGVQDGFAALLAGSGFVLAPSGSGYTLRPVPREGEAAVLPTVTVAGSTPGALPELFTGAQAARGGRVGLLGNRDVMDTPFNQTTYTAQMLADRQATTLGEALNADPSVRFTGQIGGITDSFYIRGFPIGEGNLGEIAFDGVYGIAPNYHVFTDYIERVDVLKGPGALLYGMSPNSGVGGVVNMVPKRSLPDDLSRVTADYLSQGQWGGRVDLSRRFGDDREWGVRLNGMHRQGATPLDNQRSRTDLGALALDYRGARLRATLDVILQNEKIDAPTRPMLVAGGLQVPEAPDGRRNVTQPWGWWTSDSQSALLRLEYDVTDALTVFADAGGSTIDIARLSDQTPQILNARGDTVATPSYFKFEVDRATYNAGARARFDTGPVSHNLSVQGSLYDDQVAQASRAGTPVFSNIYEPISRPRQSIAAPALVPKVSSSQLGGIALADTLGVLDDRVQLTLGLRHQRIESSNFAATGARTVHYEKSATTPLAGLVLKPWSNVSLYANYIEGLSKGDIAPATASNAGEVFEPYKSRQREVGIKVDFDDAVVSLSAFNLSKPSGQLSNGVYAADSEQRNRGLELNVMGEVAPGVRLLGGVTWLDAELTRTSNPLTQGNRPVGVPRRMASLGAQWDLPWVQGLTLLGNLVYTGQEYVNQANTQSVPSWTTVDVGARYRLRVQDRDVTLRATVANVFNRGYWSGVASYSTISQGAPRTFMLSASVDF